MSSPSSRLAAHSRMRSARILALVLGDQLDPRSPVLDGLEDDRDALWMAEVREEAEHVPGHRQRTALFLSAMRHYALDRIDDGRRVRYVRLDAAGNTQTLGGELRRALRTLAPERVRVVQPGEHRVEAALRDACTEAGVELEVVESPTFTCTRAEFDAWAEGRRELVMEHFYRRRRQELGILMTADGKPRGGRWNFDADNRERFAGEPSPPRPYRARPDAVTREVLDLVARTWPDGPGDLDTFGWPVTRAEARRGLARFVVGRLPSFGRWQDAMWEDRTWLYHSHLSSSINLMLLTPRECVDAAVEALDRGHAPINSVEGFVRQIIGWREFIRGVYYREGPTYLQGNGLEAEGALPPFFWTGETDLNCMRHALGSVVRHAYGHHIERLMVVGNFALVAGIHPRAVHEWFLGMYVDAVEWVTAPNVIGMSQHADGGVVGTKPYAASGKYIDRMSSYCGSCRYSVKERAGEDACPFNTFYWDFLIRHRKRFAANRRMAMMLKNVDRLSTAERRSIRDRARTLRAELGIGSS